MAEGEPLANPPWFHEENPNLAQYFGLIALVSAHVGESDDPQNPVRYEAWKLGGELQSQLINSAKQAIADEKPRFGVSVNLYYYQIGPAAEGPPTFLVTLWEQVQGIAPHVSSIVDFVEAAGLIWAIKRKITDWASKQNVRGIYADFILPTHTLEVICAAHVRQHYEPDLPLSTEAFPIQGTMLEYKFSAWEAGLTTLVVVSAGGSSYCYVVSSDGVVKLHYRKTNSRLEWLPIPGLVPEQ